MSTKYPEKHSCNEAMRQMRQTSPEKPCETTALLDSAAARLVKILSLLSFGKKSLIRVCFMFCEKA